MRRSILPALLVCGTLTTACASRTPSLPVAPRIQMPQAARSPCALYCLPSAPTNADLEIGYATRGAEIVACDAARALAVQTHAAEHALEDQVMKAATPSR